jgi:hypothetical protein
VLHRCNPFSVVIKIASLLCAKTFRFATSSNLNGTFWHCESHLTNHTFNIIINENENISNGHNGLLHWKDSCWNLHSMKTDRRIKKTWLTRMRRRGLKCTFWPLLKRYVEREKKTFYAFKNKMKKKFREGGSQILYSQSFAWETYA